MLLMKVVSSSFFAILNFLGVLQWAAPAARGNRIANLSRTRHTLVSPKAHVPSGTVQRMILIVESWWFQKFRMVQL